MSRNLMIDDCAVCHGAIVLEEAARPITTEECRGCELTYLGRLVVANARCVGCGTLYLAWISWQSDRPSPVPWVRKSDRPARDGDGSFSDLSFRHSFDTDPDADDLPSRATLRRVDREDTTREVASLRANAEYLRTRADRLEREAAEDPPSYWEQWLRDGR
jgi:hypothetical protein